MGCCQDDCKCEDWSQVPDLNLWHLLEPAAAEGFAAASQINTASPSTRPSCSC